MQLFFLGHGGTTFASCEDNRLATLRNRKLTLQLSSCSEERGDAWCDVVIHVVLIEESHLFLNSAKDTRIACMQTNDELSLIVELLHQFTLFFESHIGRRTNHGSWFMAIRQSLRYQRASIENKVCTLEHLTTSHTDQVRIARTCTYYLDMTSLLAQILVVDGESCRPVLTFYLGDNEFAMIRAKDGSSLADGGRTYVFLDCLTGMRNLYLGELLSCVEHQFLVVLID